MQTKRWHRIGLFASSIFPAVSMLVVPVSIANGQTQVSLQALQPAPQSAPSVLVALPNSQSDPQTTAVPQATAVPQISPATTEAGNGSSHLLILKELPRMQESKIQEFEEKAPMVVADIAVHAIPVSTMAPSQSLPVMTMVSLNTLATHQDKQTPNLMLELRRYFDLNVDDLIEKPSDAYKIFHDLRTDRKYFESALVAEPTRRQDPDVGPYAWDAHGYCWESPTFCFSPLYFEQPNLERYGQGVGRPFASTSSALKFVTDVTTLPIAVVCTPPWSCSCSLGHHRPGDCAPYQRKTLDH